MRLLTAALIVSMLLPTAARAQTQPGGAQTQAGGKDVWQRFATQLTVGSDLQVQLLDGTRFRATFIEATDASLLVQPKTRVPVPVQAVAYDAIAALEVPKRGGIGAGKAVAIGVGAGAASFWAMVAIAFAVWGD
jgi:hypothetical protein